MKHTVDARTHQLKTVVNIPLFVGFQPSFRWCRVSLAHPQTCSNHLGKFTRKVSSTSGGWSNRAIFTLEIPIHLKGLNIFFGMLTICFNGWKMKRVCDLKHVQTFWNLFLQRFMPKFGGLNTWNSILRWLQIFSGTISWGDAYFSQLQIRHLINH